MTTSTVWRCPDCGCLAVPWSRAHAPKCAYGVTHPHILESQRLANAQGDAQLLADHGSTAPPGSLGG